MNEYTSWIYVDMSTRKRRSSKGSASITVWKRGILARTSWRVSAMDLWSSFLLLYSRMCLPIKNPSRQFRLSHLCEQVGSMVCYEMTKKCLPNPCDVRFLHIYLTNSNNKLIADHTWADAPVSFYGITLTFPSDICCAVHLFLTIRFLFVVL